MVSIYPTKKNTFPDFMVSSTADISGFIFLGAEIFVTEISDTKGVNLFVVLTALKFK